MKPKLAHGTPLAVTVVDCYGCRRTGACDEPMPAREAVPFRAPDSLAVTLQLPNRGAVRGLGIRQAARLAATQRGFLSHHLSVPPVAICIPSHRPALPPTNLHLPATPALPPALPPRSRGVTLIVGGGFHGKTTLLKAVEGGIYNKVQTGWLRLELQLMRLPRLHVV